MARFVFLVVLLALLDNQLASADQKRYFIHPHFDHAAKLYNPFGGQFWSTIYKNQHASVYEDAQERVMMDYWGKEWDPTLYKYDPESNFETGLGKEYVKDGVNFLRYPVTKERERIRNFEGKDCLEQSFRGFELILRNKENEKYVGVGIAQGPGLCIIRYKPNTDFKYYYDIFRNIEDVQYINGPDTPYRITAISNTEMSNLPEANGPDWVSTVDFLDEAGHEFDYTIRQNRSGKFTIEPRVSADLTSVNFEKYSLTDMNSYISLTDFLKQNDTNIAMANHFSHSFIEAITLYRDKLIYARGIDISGQPRLHLASASSDTKAFMFGELIDKPVDSRSVNSDKTVNAIEMYDLDGKVIAHIGVSRRLYAGTDLVGLRAEPEYYFCTFANLDVFQSVTGRGLLKEYKEKDITCSNKKLYRNFMPIDIVHMPHCKKTVFFYDHWYSEIEHGKAFDESSLEKKYINWMNLPVNAILYNNGRLFVFMQGSDLLISKPHYECSWETVDFEPVYYMQSQMIMNFKKDPQAERGPFFLSSRAFQQTGANFTAEPALKSGEVRPINLEYAIKPEMGSSPNGTTPKPGVTTTATPPVGTTETPEGKPRGSTSIIIIATIVIMILAAGLFVIYYFCCGESEEPPVRRLKSNLLQSRKTARAEAEKRPAQAPPGSALTSASTVRSDINVTSSLANKSTVKPTSNVSQAVAAGKSVGPSTLSAMKTKSRSPGISPSPAKSKEALSSKRSSPKTPDLSAKTPSLSAKTLSKSKKQNKSEGVSGSKISSPKTPELGAKTPSLSAKTLSKSKKQTKPEEVLGSRNSSPKTPELGAKPLSKSKK